MKKLITSALATLMLTVPLATSAFADDSQHDVTIKGGNLTVTESAIAFSDVTLDLSQSQTSTANTKISISDARGTGAGWGVSLKATDFVQDAADPTAAGKTLKVAIPASAVKATTKDGVLVGGQAIDATNGPVKQEVRTLSATDQSLVNAAPGYGMGDYDFDADFELTVPKTVPVKEADASSKYSAGSEVGTLAGTYTSTFTFTAVAGI